MELVLKEVIKTYIQPTLKGIGFYQIGDRAYAGYFKKSNDLKAEYLA